MMMQRALFSLGLVNMLFGLLVSTGFAQGEFETGSDGSSFRIVGLPGRFDGMSNISADGLVAVGGTGAFGNFSGYWVNTTTGAFAEFSTIPGGVPGVVGPNHNSQVRGISGDGQIAFGNAESLAGKQLATAYPSGGDAFLLGGTGDLAGGSVFGEPFAASFDGSVAVGQSSGDNGTEAFRWTAATGMVGLGDLPGGNAFSRALGISNDGTVIVGDSGTVAEVDGIIINASEAFRWTAETGMVGLDDIPGGLWVSSAFGVSGDGNVLVGESGVAGPGSAGSNRVPAKWSADTDWIDLGPFPANEADPEGRRSGIAEDASFDGSVIIGNAINSIDPSNAQTAFVWTETSGLRALQGVLAEAGIDLDGWSNMRASAVSDNGRIIVGSGTSPTDVAEAFVATLPASFVGGGPGVTDLNGDGFVDGLDLGALLGNWGTNVNASGGELSGAPPVDGLDLGILLGAWMPATTTQAVPEPGTPVLGLAAWLTLLRRRENWRN